ncbi:MAG TPA: putative quinol monooxygenase [Acidimicrobiales bacterium]|nr:putative quinol monooxygenase [Acidimicrobiales bacterium]
MILITGSLTARPDTYDEVEALSLAHVRRSRLEPGCVSHAVHNDVEKPLRLVFLERWEDRAAVDVHFAVPASGDFVRQAMALCDGTPTLEIFEVKDSD